MDSAGVTGIEYMSYYDINLLMIQDNHCAYDMFKPNTIHQWVNTEITKSDNSYIIAEGTGFDDVSFSFHVLPNFFKKENVTHCDRLRFSFKIMPTVTDDRAKKTVAFLYNMACGGKPSVDEFGVAGFGLHGNNSNNSDNNSNSNANDNDNHIYDLTKFGHILQNMDMTDYKSKSAITELSYSEESFESLKYIINESVKSKNIYNRLAGTHYALNWVTLIKKLRLLEEASTNISYISQSILNELHLYELLKAHLVHLNFVHRVVTWLHSIDQTYTRTQLWDMVNKWIDEVEMFGKQLSKVALAMGRLLDYVMILKLIDIYTDCKKRNVKPLVWLCAGNAHIIPMTGFIKNMFAFIQPRGIAVEPPKQLAFNKNAVETGAFKYLINANPQYGLSDPAGVAKREAMSSQQKANSNSNSTSKSEANSNSEDTPLYKMNSEGMLEQISAEFYTPDGSPRPKQELLEIFTKRHTMHQQYQTIIMQMLQRDIITADMIIKIISLVESKEILKSYTGIEMRSIFASLESVIPLYDLGMIQLSSFGRTQYFNEQGIYTYSQKNRFCFTKPFMSLAQPTFSPEEEAEIYTNNPNIMKYLTQDNNLDIKKLQPGVDVSEIGVNVDISNISIPFPNKLDDTEYDSDVDNNTNNEDNYVVNYEYYLQKRLANNKYKELLGYIKVGNRDALNTALNINETEKPLLTDDLLVTKELIEQVSYNTYKNVLVLIKIFFEKELKVAPIDNLFKSAAMFIKKDALTKIAVSTSKSDSSSDTSSSSKDSIQGGVQGGAQCEPQLLNTLLIAILVIVFLYLVCLVYRFVKGYRFTKKYRFTKGYHTSNTYVRNDSKLYDSKPYDVKHL